jgi:hypothetical protein
MGEEKICGREAAGFLLWPGAKPIPMCAFHKEGPLRLASMMGWQATFTVAGPGNTCESKDPHPEDEVSDDG